MSGESQQRALRVFAEGVAQRATFDDAALDELCQAHAGLEAHLRRIARERAAVSVELPQVASPDVQKLGGKTTRRPRAARNRYILLGEVARGGMGVILRVWDTVLERPLAMKVLDTGSAAKRSGATEQERARFLAEARIAGRLQHPGIVPIHDLGVDEQGRVYLTMPCFEGRTLDEVFELTRTGGDGWTLERALRALSRVCEVMAYAHARDVIHRDLKPANVIVGECDAIHVVDWGLAKVLDPSTDAHEPTGDASTTDAADAGQTLAGTVAGTPPYMAPEQAEGRVEEVTFRADVYALGAMLYRLLAGRAPYEPRQEREEPESPARIVELIRRGPPTPLARLAPDAPAELVAISERAMAREPAHRYLSVEALARDLDAFLRTRTDVAAGDPARASAREGSWWS